MKLSYSSLHIAQFQLLMKLLLGTIILMGTETGQEQPSLYFISTPSSVSHPIIWNKTVSLHFSCLVMLFKCPLCCFYPFLYTLITCRPHNTPFYSVLLKNYWLHSYKHLYFSSFLNLLVLFLLHFLERGAVSSPFKAVIRWLNWWMFRTIRRSL